MKVKLSEEQITRLMKSQINEADYTSDPERDTDPKEVEIKKIFGKYAQHIPNDVIRYIRKNPSAIIKRLKDLYPEKF